MKNIIIVGGGAAGMIAAIAAASNPDTHVVLIEKNEKLGKKIYITGKGRCNFTNACDTEDFFSNVVSNPKFLYSSIYSFDSSAVIDFFESNGMPTKVERGNRAFPLSDHASDVTKALEGCMRKNGVEIHLNEEVLAILQEARDDDAAARGNIETAEISSALYLNQEDLHVENHREFIVKTNKASYIADNLVIATGGLSYPTTGSTGDGYKFAKEFGLDIKDQLPALVPFNTKEEYIKEMQGLSLKNVELSIYDLGQMGDESAGAKGKTKPVYKEFGEMLFTHFGVSGPLVLSASSKCTSLLNKNHTLVGYINLKPALSKEQLDERLIRELEANPQKACASIIRGLLPGKMLPVFLNLLNFDTSKQAASVTKADREEIINLLQRFPFTIVSTRGFKEAIITQGGVSVKDINPSTMEAKNIKGLYFAGEVLDLDAYTGGFNLQIAFSTGYLAGVSIV